MKIFNKKNDRMIYKASDIAVIVAAMAGAFISISEYERHMLTIAQYKIYTTKPIEEDRRIVFLSDLHSHHFGDSNIKMIEMIDKLKPDAILIGGDMLTATTKPSIECAIELCSKLIDRYKIYYADGNHENRLKYIKDGKYIDIYEKLSRELDHIGVHHIVDDSAMLDNDIRITGLDIDKRYYGLFSKSNMRLDYIENKVGMSYDDLFEIMMPHTPDYLEAYSKWGADLVLAGHKHGGIITIPGGRGLLTPSSKILDDNVVGLKTYNNTAMIISSGLGTHGIDIRINNKPQIVSVDIIKKQ